ncbi:hypothetical protein [Streptomyces sp. NPDC053048]|uniref:hypothetical protein n=1 Tax=Streptomyces sp. NPDC053048 TaxID=3365694 RepID=UPI0037CF7359
MRLAIRDSRSEAAGARIAVKELVQDERADIIVTLAGTQVLPAVSDACEELGVPCLSSTFPWQVYYFGRGATVRRPFTWSYHFCWGLDDIASVFTDMWEVVGPGQKIGCLWNTGPQGTWSRTASTGCRRRPPAGSTASSTRAVMTRTRPTSANTSPRSSTQACPS